MSVAKVIEITSTSAKSFEAAIQKGIARADKTLNNVEGAWIKEQKVIVTDGKINGFRVNMLVTFVLGNTPSQRRSVSNAERQPARVIRPL
jgi:dodecin